MPEKQPSPEAMRAARDWIVYERECDYLQADLYPGTRHLAKFIDNYMQSKWIKCSERMPDERIWVLATYGEGIQFLGARRDENWVCSDDELDLEGQDKITHWMPLPNDPEPEDAP